MNCEPETILKVDTRFARQGATDWAVDLFACYQCGKCSNGCPVTFAMDYPPHQLIRMLQLGLVEEVLRSKTIWVCASCETCSTRCPNEVDVAKLMDNLKQQVLARKETPSEETVAEFHKAFLKNIKMFGRVNETFLMGAYQMKSALADFKKTEFQISGIVKNLRLALNMLKRGRLAVIPRWRGRAAVRRIFKES